MDDGTLETSVIFQCQRNGEWGKSEKDSVRMLYEEKLIIMLMVCRHCWFMLLVLPAIAKSTKRWFYWTHWVEIWQRMVCKTRNKVLVRSFSCSGILVDFKSCGWLMFAMWLRKKPPRSRCDVILHTNDLHISSIFKPFEISWLLVPFS